MAAPMKLIRTQRLAFVLNNLNGCTLFSKCMSNQMNIKHITHQRYTQEMFRRLTTSSNKLQAFVNEFARVRKVGDPSTFDMHLRSKYQAVVTCRLISSVQKRLCWKCGKETDLDKELFFCKCGVVQSVSEVSYFQLMGITPTFDIDVLNLSVKFRDLQRLLHPDRYSQKSEREQELSELQSSIVNKAYSTLLKPLSRALYMLELHGQPLEEDNTDVDQDFLINIMEINEEIMDSESVEDLKQVEADNKERIETCVSNISQAFKSGDVRTAKEHVIHLKYFTNIDDKIKDIYNKNFGI